MRNVAGSKGCCHSKMEVIQSVANRSLEISYVSIEISFFHLCLLVAENEYRWTDEREGGGGWALKQASSQAGVWRQF